LIYQGNDKIFESGKQESRKGISEIEGKGAMGSAERALVASEFQTRKGAFPSFLLSLFDSFRSSCPPPSPW
jgi:hypothetical protein